jgi:hypothetical protein
MFAPKKPTSVNDVIAAFERNIKDLEDVTAYQMGKAEFHQSEVTGAMLAHDAAKTEADRAAGIAKKLKGLFA